MSRAVSLLRQRLAQATAGDRSAWGDIGFALGVLAEAGAPPWLKPKPGAADPKAPDAAPTPIADGIAPEDPTAAADASLRDDAAPAAETADEQVIMRDGRVEMLHDLQRRSLAAESTHDPAVVQDLIAALTAFLNEELTEALAEPEGPTPTAEELAEAPLDPMPSMTAASEETDPMVTPDNADTATADQAFQARKGAAEADNFMQYSPTAAEQKPEPDADVALQSRREAAEADGFGLYGATDAAATAPAPTCKCEACGHETAVKTKEDGMAESISPTAGAPTPTTPTVPAIAAVSATPMTEAERSELVALRADKRKRDEYGRAVALIAAKEATGYVKPDELVGFQESTWPVLVDRWMRPPPEYGTGVRDMPAPLPGMPARESAADTFDRHFRG